MRSRIFDRKNHHLKIGFLGIVTGIKRKLYIKLKFVLRYKINFLSLAYYIYHSNEYQNGEGKKFSNPDNFSTPKFIFI